jgi:hypothetical protein
VIAYVYFKGSNIINCKINNVEYISDNDKEIRGNTNSIKYGDSQDYIILESDIINKNIGDVIDLNNIEDARDFFLKGKDYWYQEQIKKHEEIIQSQKRTIDGLNNDMNTALLGIADVYEQILGGGTTS